MAEDKKIATGHIGNALRSTAADHTTTFADEVFDTERQRYQNEVNTDLEQSIEAETARAEAAEEANAQAIEDETARATTAEAAETARATAEEARLQDEIDNTNNNLNSLDDKVNLNQGQLTELENKVEGLIIDSVEKKTFKQGQTLFTTTKVSPSQRFCVAIPDNSTNERFDVIVYAGGSYITLGKITDSIEHWYDYPENATSLSIQYQGADEITTDVLIYANLGINRDVESLKKKVSSNSNTISEHNNKINTLESSQEFIKNDLGLDYIVNDAVVVDRKNQVLFDVACNSTNVGIQLSSNTTFTDVAVIAMVSGQYINIGYITDNDWHIIDMPDGATRIALQNRIDYGLGQYHVKIVKNNGIVQDLGTKILNLRKRIDDVVLKEMYVYGSIDSYNTFYFFVKKKSDGFCYCRISADVKGVNILCMCDVKIEDSNSIIYMRQISNSGCFGYIMFDSKNIPANDNNYYAYEVGYNAKDINNSPVIKNYLSLKSRPYWEKLHYTKTDENVIIISKELKGKTISVSKKINRGENDRIDIVQLVEGSFLNVCTLREGVLNAEAVIDINAKEIYLQKFSSFDADLDIAIFVDGDFSYTLNGIKQSITEIHPSSKIYNPKKELKQGVKILDIGNSFSADPQTYLPDIISAVGVSSTDYCLYTAVRSGATFKNWFDMFHDKDVAPSGVGSYSINRKVGGITQPITGSADKIIDTNYFNGERFRSALVDCQWDIVIIHQGSTYSDNWRQWEGHGDGGYLNELIQLIKTYQPNAMIGMLMPHASFNQSPNGRTAERWAGIAESVKWFSCNYSVDFIIPVATALEIVRKSSINTSLHGLSEDSHHTASGLGDYVGSCVYYQSVFAPIFGKSIVGNTFRVDVSSLPKPSGYESDFISVTDNTASVAQMATILACSDFYKLRDL